MPLVCLQNLMMVAKPWFVVNPRRPQQPLRSAVPSPIEHRVILPKKIPFQDKSPLCKIYTLYYTSTLQDAFAQGEDSRDV